MRLNLACLFLVFVAATSCTQRLTQSELATMTAMNTGWRDDITEMNGVIQHSALEFKRFEDALQDTSMAGSHLLRKDSLFMARHAQETAHYQRWYGMGLASLHELYSLVLGNVEWLLRLQPGKSPVVMVRRAWDSRRLHFYEMHSQGKAIPDQYPSVSKRWAAHTGHLALN